MSIAGLRAAVIVTVVTAAVSGCAGTPPPGSEAADSEAAGDAVAVIRAPDDGFRGTLIERPLRRPDLTLPDTSGAPFHLAQRPPGEVTVLFFGYTHCPDVCPTTMADLAAARRSLPGDVRDRVQVVFVTEDPARDTPAVLREWLDRLDHDFVGLIGGNAATRHALRHLALSQTKKNTNPSEAISQPPARDTHAHARGAHGSYAIEHPGSVYAFGPGGRTVLYSGGETVRDYAKDFAVLAGETAQ